MKTRKAKRKLADDILAPSPEQMGRGEFVLGDIVDAGVSGGQVRIGKAYRRKPMIDTLAGQGLFSDAEYKALKHYRHHADLADRSLVRDSLNIQRSGGTGIPTVGLLNAIRVRDDCERAAGSLADILRAVVIDDQSLSQWAIERAGGKEQCRDRKGKRVCAIEPRPDALRIAQVEMKVVAGRIEAEVAAPSLDGRR